MTEAPSKRKWSLVNLSITMHGCTRDPRFLLTRGNVVRIQSLSKLKDGDTINERRKRGRIEIKVKW